MSWNLRTAIKQLCPRRSTNTATLFNVPGMSSIRLRVRVLYQCHWLYTHQGIKHITMADIHHHIRFRLVRLKPRRHLSTSFARQRRQGCGRRQHKTSGRPADRGTQNTMGLSSAVMPQIKLRGFEANSYCYTSYSSLWRHAAASFCSSNCIWDTSWLKASVHAYVNRLIKCSFMNILFSFWRL